MTHQFENAGNYLVECKKCKLQTLAGILHTKDGKQILDKTPCSDDNNETS